MGTERVAMGAVTSGIPRGTLVDRIAEFVRGALADWRDDPTRPEVDAEVSLNGQLCKYLNARAREVFPMIAFNHEEPQGNRRTVDLSVTQATTAGGNIYEPVLVIEGKRLPAPATDREREYLTGRAARSGGIQRFKLGLHGATLARGMIVAYLQHNTARHWLDTLNGWIREFARAAHTEHDAWLEDDLLRDFEERPDNTARCESDHARPSGDRVRLHHAWVEMRRRTSRSRKHRREAKERNRGFKNHGRSR